MNKYLWRSGIAVLAATMMSTAFALMETHTDWRVTTVNPGVVLNPGLNFVSQYHTFETSYRGLKSAYDTIPVQRFGQIATGHIVLLPNAEGKLSRFRIAESPILSPELSWQIPSRTYRISGIDDPWAVGRLDTGYNGFHAFIRSPKGDYVIDPINLGERNVYAVYYRSDNQRPRNEFSCHVVPTVTKRDDIIHAYGGGGTFKTYRLAINATAEYTAFFGSFAAAQAAIVTSVNRVNQVYEIDASLTMTIVRNNPFTDPNSDPYSNDDGFAMLSQNQAECDTNPGDAGYDIGHVFSTGGGGIAALRSVGVSGAKGQGVTGSSSPVGDAFDIDYVAHEMGHQYGGNHTFNGTSGACGGSRSTNAAYEPGSGTTIQAYAGICGAENVQPNSNAYFHAKSMDEIWAWRNNAASGGTSVNNGNQIPTANAGADFTIPANTPFKLTATGTDPQGDPITFCWEQFDLGSATSSASQYSTGPLFRSFTPSASPTRFFPNFTSVKNNAVDNFDKVPLTDRIMNFRVTVRDNRAGGGAYQTDDARITVAGAKFEVTAPNTNVSLTGGNTTTVTWTVGGGSVAPNVRILFSSNGGDSYAAGTATVLLASTPNDGSQSVTIPNVTSTQCRIIVEAVGNVFYDMSNVNFQVSAGSGGLDSVVINDTVVEGGLSTFGTVNLSAAAPSGGTTVNLSDGGNVFVGVPANVLVPGNSTQGNFNITTSSTTSNQSATITATLAAATRTATMTVIPIALPSTLMLNPTSVVGGQLTNATVTLDRNAPTAGTVITVSDNSASATSPASVTVAGGSNSATFQVTTVPVNSTVGATVTVSRGTITRAQTLTIAPPKIADFQIVGASIQGGNSTTGTVTLNGQAPSARTINIVDNTVATTVPATVIIPTGATQATFSITTIAVSSNQVSTVLVSLNGVGKTDTLTVLPPVLNSITINVTSIKGGLNAVGTLNMSSPAPAAGLPVTCSSNNTAAATVPATVVVSPAAVTKTFTITTKVVTSSTLVTISATRASITRTRGLTVTP
jgi:hypothetical protein